MEILSKKSHEFSKEEIQQIYDLYEKVFHERRDEKFFHEQFCNTSKGYSYHAVAVDNGKIVGHNVYVPFEYLKDDTPFTLVLSIDAMVDPDYQGKGIYGKLLKACESLALKEDVKIRIGFPNENSYPIQMKAYKYYDFGTLDTYCLPLKPSHFKGILKIFDPLTSFIARRKLGDGRIKMMTFPYEAKFRKNRESFNVYRYKWFDGKYHIVKFDDEVRFVYKKFSFKGIEATFLMDFYPVTRQAFESACRYIGNKDKESTALFYVGQLPFKQSSLFKLPKKLEPKKFHFVAKVFDKDFIGEEGLDINNWDMNLASFDLL